MTVYEVLAKAKTVADDEWFDYSRMPRTYQEDHPQSYWYYFLLELEHEGYEVHLKQYANSKKWSESMADVS